MYENKKKYFATWYENKFMFVKKNDIVELHPNEIKNNSL